MINNGHSTANHSHCWTHYSLEQGELKRLPFQPKSQSMQHNCSKTEGPVLLFVGIVLRMLTVPSGMTSRMSSLQYTKIHCQENLYQLSEMRAEHRKKRKVLLSLEATLDDIATTRTHFCQYCCPCYLPLPISWRQKLRATTIKKRFASIKYFCQSLRWT